MLKTGFYGTEEIIGAKNRLLWYATHLQRPAEQPTPQTVDSLLGYATHLQRHSVLKTGFYGTEEIFGTKNRLLWYATHFQRRAVPKAASCRTGRIFSARNVPRSEVSRHKKETKVKDFDLFCRGTVTRTQDPLVPNQMR